MKEKGTEKKKIDKRYMLLRYDRVFKGFFGREDNKDLLISMLNNYLDLDIKTKEDIELINTELAPDNYKEKVPRLDLRVRTSKGEQVNVEIQVGEQVYFLKRLDYYNCKMYSGQEIKGMSYKDLKPAISLAITIFDIFESESYRNRIFLYHEQSGKRVLEDRLYCVIDLNKYMRIPNKEEKDRDLWSELLIASTEEDFEKLEKRGGIMAEAVRKLKYFSQEEADRYWPEMIEKYEIDMISNKEMYEQRGIEIGKEQGITEAQRKIALNMLKLGLDNKTISEATGLSLDEISNLE